MGPWAEGDSAAGGNFILHVPGHQPVVDAWHAGTTVWRASASDHRTRSRVALLEGDLLQGVLPQLIAGPTVKANEFFFQIGPKAPPGGGWVRRVRLLILGFFLKMVVADNLREVTEGIRYPSFSRCPGSTSIALLYVFVPDPSRTSAGTDHRHGAHAKLFGYELPRNFNHPYLSRSITEF